MSASDNLSKVQRIQELRRSNAAGAVPSKKVYNRKKLKKITPPAK